MTQWVNFAELRASVSLEDVILRYYGITTLTREGDKLVGPCPVHGGDSVRAFHADLGKNVWHCFSRCKGGGNQLDFVVRKENISVREAALQLQAFFAPGTQTGAPAGPPRGAPTGTSPPGNEKRTGPGSTPPARPARAAKEPVAADKDEKNPVLDLKLNLLGDHPHLVEERRLSLECIEHFGVGYCPRGTLAGTIAIPIHDEAGNLVAYAGRHLKPQTIREHGKYKFPKNFRKHLVLFNLHRAREHAEEGRGLLLVEGFFTVLKLWDLGVKNVVASMGCDLSDAQASLLADAQRVFILMDGNDAGYTGAAAARDTLHAVGCKTHLIRLPDGLEPEDLSPRALRWVVNGMRELELSELSFLLHAASLGTTPKEP